jgi:hypothetical protein
MNLTRIVRLMRTVIAELDLDLSGLTVYTEAATGAYAVTAVLGALARAQRVYALARDNRYATSDQALAETKALAQAAGIDAAIEYVLEKRQTHLAKADIVTNAGNLRPLDAQTIGWLNPGAVIPLMYESWELRHSDLDINACWEKGIAIAGTNERHPKVRLFDYLGMMALKLMLDSGFEVLGSRIAVVCNNPFAPYLARTLVDCGAEVRAFGAAEQLAALSGKLAVLKTFAELEPADFAGCDAVLVAASPQGEPAVIGSEGKALISAPRLAHAAPGVEVFEFCWGGAVERDALAGLDVSVWPTVAPPKGHMSVIPSALGAAPLVRLQAGGLKVGELLSRLRRAGASMQEIKAQMLTTGYGDLIEA